MNKKSKSKAEQFISLNMDMSLNKKTENNMKNVTGAKISDTELLKELEDLIRTANGNATTGISSNGYEQSLSISNDMDASFSSVISDAIDEETIIMEATKAMNQIIISEHEVSLHSSGDELEDSDLIQELDTILSVTTNVQFKHSDKPEPIAHIKDTKTLQSRTEQLSIKLKSKPDAPEITEKPNDLQISTNASDNMLLLRLRLPEVKKRLEHQIKFAIKMSHYYLHKSNRQEADKKKALEMHSIKKQSQRSLELVESLPNINENDSITVLKQQIQYEQQEELLDIPPNKIRVVITHATGIDDLMLASGKRGSSLSPPDTFIQITLPSHIDDKNPQMYTSGIVKNSFHPQYPSCIAMFQVERSKSFLKFLERKKLIIEIIQNRGLFRKNVILGKALVPLQDILKQCEVIFDNFEIIPEQQSRYKSHARIHGTISTRIPFDANHKKIIDEEFIHVDENFISFSPVVINNQSINKTIVNAYKLDKIDIDAQFYDSRSIISNLVLEKEIEEMNNMLSSGDNEELRMIKDRKDSYELQKQIIVCQVEAGILTPDAYISALKDAITKEKKRTLECKHMNRIDLAKKGLMRIKLMEQEVKELNAP